MYTSFRSITLTSLSALSPFVSHPTRPLEQHIDHLPLHTRSTPVTRPILIQQLAFIRLVWIGGRVGGMLQWCAM
jgi:hypothetical protein